MEATQYSITELTLTTLPAFGKFLKSNTKHLLTPLPTLLQETLTFSKSKQGTHTDIVLSVKEYQSSVQLFLQDQQYRHQLSSLATS